MISPSLYLLLDFEWVLAKPFAVENNILSFNQYYLPTEVTKTKLDIPVEHIFVRCTSTLWCC